MRNTFDLIRRATRYPIDRAVREDLNEKLERSLAWSLSKNNSEGIGIRNRMRLAKTYNYLRHRGGQRIRENAYRQEFDALIAENGALPTEPVTIRDGWAIDTTRALPFLAEFIRDAKTIIGERGGVSRRTDGKLFMQDLMTEPDLVRFPSFLNFATSSDVLSVASAYVGMVPILCEVNLFESNAAFSAAHRAAITSSQLFHIDDADDSFLRVIVHVGDVTPACGPFCFLPAAASRAAQAALGYRRRGRPYRVTDEEMYRVVDRQELVEAVYPSGTVLWMDACRCFHYGSRDATEPRYLAMIDFVSPSRTDFRQVLSPRRFSQFARPGDSRLRRMVLDEAFGEHRGSNGYGGV